MRAQNENDTVALPEYVTIHLKCKMFSIFTVNHIAQRNLFWDP